LIPPNEDQLTAIIQRTQATFAAVARPEGTSDEEYARMLLAQINLQYGSTGMSA